MSNNSLFFGFKIFVIKDKTWLFTYIKEITDAMKRVVSLKNNLLKYSSIEELNDMRKNITDGIEKVATLENVANTKYGKGNLSRQFIFNVASKIIWK